MEPSAVITADIVNSTKLSAVQEKKLLAQLHQLLQPWQFEFYRGDSFQVFQQKATLALKTALQCRTAAIRLTTSEATPPFDVKVSIGIGQARAPVKSLRTAKGNAFVLSGRALDEITPTTRRLSIVTTNTLANEGLQVIADYLNAIFKGMTGKQAGVIFELLKGHTQQQVSDQLKKSKSTIHQHVNAGRWPEIERLLQQYDNILKHLP